MGFFTRWTSKGGQILFCFDIPLMLRDRLQAPFLSPSTTPKLSDIYSPHVLIINEIINLFDRSVWSLRDIVRATEMVKLLSYATRKERQLTIISRTDQVLYSRSLTSHCFMILHGTRSTPPSPLTLRSTP